jgi:hypothetical protein
VLPLEVDGIVLGYMDRAGRAFAVVRVLFDSHDLILERPTQLATARHLGRQRLSATTVLNDTQASLLIDDVIECNPSQVMEIGSLLAAVNQVRRQRRVRL